MSAWIVTDGHIDVLVNGLVQYGLLAPRSTAIQTTGQMLWEENHRSVNARYNEDTETPLYQPMLVESDLDYRALVAAIHCYNYQSCEHDGWDTSEAAALMEQLSAAVTLRHPNAEHEWSNGDRESWFKWGYDSVEEAMLR